MTQLAQQEDSDARNTELQVTRDVFVPRLVWGLTAAAAAITLRKCSWLLAGVVYVLLLFRIFVKLWRGLGCRRWEVWTRQLLAIRESTIIIDLEHIVVGSGVVP